MNQLLLAVPQQLVTHTTLAPIPEPLVPDKKKADAVLGAAYVARGFTLFATVIAGIFGLWQGVFAQACTAYRAITVIQSL